MPYSAPGPIVRASVAGILKNVPTALGGIAAYVALTQIKLKVPFEICISLSSHGPVTNALNGNRLTNRDPAFQGDLTTNNNGLCLRNIGCLKRSMEYGASKVLNFRHQFLPVQTRATPPECGDLSSRTLGTLTKHPNHLQIVMNRSVWTNEMK